VNIDNGFGAAILAGQILRTADKLQMPSDVPKVSERELRGKRGRGTLFSVRER